MTITSWLSEETGLLDKPCYAPSGEYPVTHPFGCGQLLRRDRQIDLDQFRPLSKEIAVEKEGLFCWTKTKMGKPPYKAHYIPLKNDANLAYCIFPPMYKFGAKSVRAIHEIRWEDGHASLPSPLTKNIKEGH